MNYTTASWCSREMGHVITGGWACVSPGQFYGASFANAMGFEGIFFTSPYLPPNGAMFAVNTSGLDPQYFDADLISQFSPSLKLWAPYGIHSIFHPRNSQATGTYIAEAGGHKQKVKPSLTSLARFKNRADPRLLARPIAARWFIGRDFFLRSFQPESKKKCSNSPPPSPKHFASSAGTPCPLPSRHSCRASLSPV